MRSESMAAQLCDATFGGGFRRAPLPFFLRVAEMVLGEAVFGCRERVDGFGVRVLGGKKRHGGKESNKHRKNRTTTQEK